MSDFMASTEGALVLGTPLYIIQVLIVGFEYFYAKRWRDPPLSRQHLDFLIVGQLLAPLLFFLVYPLMPGSSHLPRPSLFSWGMSVKTTRAFEFTVILCATVTFFAFCKVIRFGEKKEPNQPPEPTR